MRLEREREREKREKSGEKTTTTKHRKKVGGRKKEKKEEKMGDKFTNRAESESARVKDELNPAPALTAPSRHLLSNPLTTLGRDLR